MKSFSHRKLHLQKRLYLRYIEATNVRPQMVGMMAIEAPSFCLLFYLLPCPQPPYYINQPEALVIKKRLSLPTFL